MKQVDLTSGDAGAAFAAGRVPVAVTWQPWLDRTKKNPNGHVLVSSKQYPTIITDQVGFTPDFIKKNPETVQAFVERLRQGDGLHQGRIPTRRSATPRSTSARPTRRSRRHSSDVPLWTLQQSRAYYGTPAKHGQIYKIFTKAGAVLEVDRGDHERAVSERRDRPELPDQGVAAWARPARSPSPRPARVFRAGRSSHAGDRPARVAT